ncbi:MAG: CHAT domain-containing protein [Candidatus Omnitrophica bacterium]|nr:CHAT domain-containing protein [Candidatus Omnitrophota bacterium]
MPESNTLVLEIFRQDHALKMSLFEQGELALTLRHYSQTSVSFIEIDKLCQEVVSLLNKANRKITAGQDLIVSLTKVGQLLWDNLLTRPVKERLKSSSILGLILSIDEELINIPWEFLYDGKSFLSLNFNLGRVVRTKEEISLPQYRGFSPTLKMLILANPTNDLKSAYLEGINIRNQFDRKRNNVHIDFKSTSIDKLYVKKHFCEYDIVHFAGHCEYDPANPENSGWVLSDGRFSVEDILNMGSTISLPILVFSNACHWAKATPGLIDLDYQQKNYNLASAFLFSGVRHYLGAIRRIEDPVSLENNRGQALKKLSGRIKNS